jgi:Cell envelope-related transcriptional attenuator domain.
MNILLLGTDERTLTDSARTDAMLICSINRNTGEVKLTSIMRDLAVELPISANTTAPTASIPPATSAAPIWR